MIPVEWFGYAKCVCFVFWIQSCSISNAFHFIILMDNWYSCVVLIIVHVSQDLLRFRFRLIYLLFFFFFIRNGERGMGDFIIIFIHLRMFSLFSHFNLRLFCKIYLFFAFSLLQSAICILFIRVPHFILWVDYNVWTAEKKRVQKGRERERESENLANDNEHTKYIKN